MNPLRAHAAAAVLLTIFLPTHALNTTASPSSSPSDACEAATCGGLRIAYPFWLGGTHLPECGYHAFQVSCDANGTASLKNSFWMYHILHISYDHSDFTVANVQLVGDDACNVEMLGVNASSDLGLSPFGISAANQELFFLYNCTELRSRPPPPAWATVGCTGGDGPDASATFNSYAWLAGGYMPDDAWRPVEGNCTVSMMPVLGYQGDSGKDYRRLIKGGFLLDYTAGEDCAACVHSGGFCRINTTFDTFECHCGDRVSDLIICYGYSQGVVLDPVVVLPATGGSAWSYGRWMYPYDNGCAGYLQPSWVATY